MTTNTKHVRIGAALFMLSVLIGETHADPGVVVVGGTAADHQRATVGAAVEQATRDAGWGPPPTPLPKKDVDALLRCSETTTPWSCMPASLGSNGVQRVFVVTTDATQGTTGTPVVTLVGKLILTSPESAVVRQRFCEHCTDDRLGKESTELARQMLRELAVRLGRTVVTIKTAPEGAEIILDGESIGATNQSYKTYPGEHVVMLDKPGYMPEMRAFTAEEGKTSEVSVTLRSSTGEASVPTTPRRSRVVPGLVGGIGVVALASGIALQVTKDSPPVGQPQPSRVYSAPGIGLAVGGAVLVGLGAYLWSRASVSPSASSPSVSLVEGGGVVGWSHVY